MNYYKRHLGDYARDAGHLTATEHGIYTLLLDWYYVHESPIPDAMAHRIARSNRDETQSVLSEFFTLGSDGAWSHRRCDAEIAEYRKQAEKNRANGAAGGRPAKTQWVSSGNQEETDAKATGNLSHKPLAINQEKEEAKKPPAPSARRSAVELQTWIDSLPADEQLIPPGDTIFDYAEKVGIPDDYLLLAWEEFCERMQGKRQKDWRAHYRNAVRGNSFKLWWMRDGSQCELTTQGEQAKRRHGL